MVVASVAMGYVGYETYNSQYEGTLLLENVEALANDYENKPSCDNINGYRQWETSGGLFKKEKCFYDCCYKQQTGYSPEGTCMKY